MNFTRFFNGFEVITQLLTEFGRIVLYNVEPAAHGGTADGKRGEDQMAPGWQGRLE